MFGWSVSSRGWLQVSGSVAPSGWLGECELQNAVLFCLCTGFLKMYEVNGAVAFVVDRKVWTRVNSVRKNYNMNTCPIEGLSVRNLSGFFIRICRGIPALWSNGFEGSESEACRCFQLSFLLA